jgi:hypothetical protein
VGTQDVSGGGLGSGGCDASHGPDHFLRMPKACHRRAQQLNRLEKRIRKRNPPVKCDTLYRISLTERGLGGTRGAPAPVALEGSRMTTQHLRDLEPIHRCAAVTARLQATIIHES